MKMRHCCLLVVVGFVLVIKVLVVEAVCPGGQTSISCSCTAQYSIGKNDFVNADGLIQLNSTVFKTFFTVPLAEDCGLGLTCFDKFDCEQRCLEGVKKKLEAETNNLDLYLCQRLAGSIKTVNDKYGIHFYAAWSYGMCRSGRAPVVKDLCCNRQCACDLVLQKPDTSNVDPSVAVTGKLPNEPFYKCSNRDIDVCLPQCLNNFRAQFNERIDPAEEKNMNLFVKNRDFGPKICSLFKYLTRALDAPGGDLFLRVDVGVDDDLRLFQLGRTCCKLDCDCKLNYANAHRNRTDVMYIKSMNQVAYQCHEQLSQCMKYCRNWALNLGPGYQHYCPLETSTPRIDKFNDLQFGIEIAKLLKPAGIPMVTDTCDINLLVTTNKITSFPYRESLNLGQLCYNFAVLNGEDKYFPSNRCIWIDKTPELVCLKF